MSRPLERSADFVVRRQEDFARVAKRIHIWESTMPKLERGQGGGDEGSCWMRMGGADLELVSGRADRRGEKFTIQRPVQI
jgi:hypothetical protein